MCRTKPWTVMVYLAADNNLANFAVDSLKQMKAVSREAVNVVAEFDSGPLHPTKRYLFDGGTAYGSIQQNEVNLCAPKNAGDPTNLTDFISWAATHYPAERYFLIIWGHGGGVDDDFPNASDRSFVHRHDLLGLGKGTQAQTDKGTQSQTDKGTQAQTDKGTLDVTVGTILDRAHAEIHAQLTGGIGLALKNACRCEAAKENGSTFQHEVLSALENGTLGALHRSVLDGIHKCIGACLQEGVQGAVELGIFDVLLQQLPHAWRQGGASAVDDLVLENVHSGVLDSLLKQVLNALQDGMLGFSQPNSLPQTKSLAFVDHPECYLTNIQLKQALQEACKSIKGGKIDIVGLDACNMNMVEIGYEVRDCVRYLVASQDEIPDASWPYDQILRQIADNPHLLARDVACFTAHTFRTAYHDYLDQPVALSVLNLDSSAEIHEPFRTFTAKLMEAKNYPGLKRAICSARHQTKSFCGNQFADIIHFCQVLAETPGSRDLCAAALELSAKMRSLIACNEIGGKQLNCNGISIYFPEYDPAQHDHQQRMAELYNRLDFARETGWGNFISALVEQERENQNLPPLPVRPPAGWQGEDRRTLVTNAKPTAGMALQAVSHNGK